MSTSVASSSPVALPISLVDRVSMALLAEHAGHLIPAALTALGPHVSSRPVDSPDPGGRAGVHAVNVDAVIALSTVLRSGGRPELLSAILLAARPWLPLLPFAPQRAHSLTEREVEVLHLVSYGHTNGWIGEKLCLAEDTIKAVLQNVYAKLGADDRAHAVRLGIEYGALEFIQI